jgi:hypothetical protein
MRWTASCRGRQAQSIFCCRETMPDRDRSWRCVRSSRSRPAKPGRRCPRPLPLQARQSGRRRKSAKAREGNGSPNPSPSSGESHKNAGLVRDRFEDVETSEQARWQAAAAVPLIIRTTSDFAEIVVAILSVTAKLERSARRILECTARGRADARPRASNSAASRPHPAPAEGGPQAPRSRGDAAQCRPLQCQ